MQQVSCYRTCLTYSSVWRSFLYRYSFLLKSHSPTGVVKPVLLHHIGPAMADSTLKCNVVVVEEYLARGQIAEPFARSIIELVLDPLQFLRGDRAEVSAAREELT